MDGMGLLILNPYSNHVFSVQDEIIGLSHDSQEKKGVKSSISLKVDKFCRNAVLIRNYKLEGK